MLHIDFSNKRTLTSSVVYKQNEIDNKGVSAKLINVDLDENSSGAAFWTSPSGETMQTEFVINGEIGTFKVPTSEIGTWILELVVYNDGRPKSADYNFEILKSYSVDPSNAEIELLIETIVRHDHTYTQNENIRIENENTRIIEHGDRMSKSDVATANAIQATHNADQATANANEATQRANDSAENAEHAIENMVQLTGATVTATANANAQAEHAKMQGDYAKTQGDHAKQATIDASNATSLTNQTIQQANTATTNAVNATNNAVTATERANTATQQADTATANAETATQATIQATTEARSATTNAIQATNNAQTATTNANTATANANNATVNANTATTNANTATTKANQAVTSVQNAIAAGTVDLETKQARTDATGFVHANLKTRLDEEFKELASKIPTDVAFDGYGAITTNDTLSGDVKSVVVSGNTIADLEAQTIQSAEVSEVTSHGVNLVDVPDKINDNFFKTKTGFKINTYYSNNTNDIDIIGKLVEHITPNKTYTAMYDTSHSGNSYEGRFVFYEKNGVLEKPFMLARGQNNVAPQWIKNAELVYYYGISNVNLEVTNYRVYEVTGSEPSTYVPYTSSKTTLSEPITLRSLPNGVADTYDVDTGVLTRRCGEVVLNGGESWEVNTSVSSKLTNCIALFAHNGLTGTVTSKNLTCDRFIPSTAYAEDAEKVGTNNAKGLLVLIEKSRLTTPDVAGFKAWLTANPTTVVYQLAEPTTEYIENNGQLRSYDYQTTVTAESVVPVKLSGNIPVNYASTLAKTLMRVDELKEENKKLLETIETLSNDVNQIHAFMYAMMGTANTLEEE